ncbi:hypothetical protein KC973_01145 [Candidatus Saccharibacteria bacterium]|nr:hypothetical protein [Candidatus Saccharibacteria bacterium]
MTQKKSSKKQPTKRPEAVVASRIQNKLSGYKQSIQLVPSVVKRHKDTQVSRYKKWREEDRKKLKYRSFRLQKRIKPELKPLPTSWELIKDSLRFLWRHKRIMFGIFLVQLAVYFVIVRAPVQPDVESIQDSITSLVKSSGTEISGVRSSAVTLGAVLSSTGSTQQNGAIGAVMLFTFSLIYVWALRHLHNGSVIKVRDALYQGITSVVPVLFVVGVIMLEIFPFAFASFVYTLARTSGIFVTGFEDLTFFTAVMLLGLLLLFWMTSAVIALYMAALPGVYPMYALKSAKQMVQFQRVRVFRRMVALPLMLAVLYIILLLISIRFFPSKTFIVAEITQLMFVPIIHTYLYKLYRSML